MPTILERLRNKKVMTLSLSKGFTIIEVLIVISILALLMIALITSMGSQRSKAEDARVKTDLERLRIAFEDYYNDNNCYPPPEWFDDTTDCGSNHLNPYLNTMPCDKETNEPYKIFYFPSQCGGFQLYGQLQNASDPAYAQYIDGPNGVVGNYGVSSSNVTVENPGEAGSSGEGGQGGDSNYYWCSGIGNCTSYDPNLFDCSPSYTDNPNCDNQSCASVGSCSPQ